MSGLQSDNKRIAKNTLFLYVRMFFLLIVSLYTSRVVLSVLGASDFGLYSVVAGFVSLFGFFNATLSSSMSRFLNFEAGRHGDAGVSEVYTAGIYIHLLFAIIIAVVLESFGIWYVNNVLVVEEGKLHTANVVFQYAVFSAVFMVMQIPYSSAIISFEKMDFYAWISIIDVVFKLAIALVLPVVPSDKLETYSLLLLLASIFNFLIYFIYAKHVFPQLRMRRSVKKNIFHSFISFSGWNLFGTLAFTIKGQGINLLLNFFFGTVVNAARAVAYQINNAVSSFYMNISIAFRPQIVDAYSKENFARVKELFVSETKICFCMVLVLIVPVIVEMDYILQLWLGSNVPEQTGLFSKLVLIDMLVGTLNTPTTHVVFSSGKIKMYQIASSIINFLLLPFCWILLKSGASAAGCFVLNIVFSVINQIVCLICMKKVFDYSIHHYLTVVVIPLALITMLLPAVPLMVKLSLDSSLLRLITVCLSDALVALLLFWFIVLDRGEKRVVLNFVRKKKWWVFQ